MAVFVLLVLTALLAGCETAPTSESEVGATFEVGSNRAGDPCSLISAVAPPKIAEAKASYYLLQCGKWERPSGAVFVVDAGGKSARDLVASGWWRIRMDQFVTCAKPEPTSVLDGVSALGLDCRLNKGDWPYQAIAVELGQKIYLADSIPNAYEPLEHSVGVLAGRLSPARTTGSSGEMSGEMQRIQGRLAGADFSVGDITYYNDLRRLARYYNFRGEYALAEAQYRKAWEWAETHRPDQEAYLAMHIALELSNQQKFEAADAMFQRARAALALSSDPPSDKARLTGYEAIHLANQGKSQESILTARKATEMFEASDYGGSPGGRGLSGGREFNPQSGLLRGGAGQDVLSVEEGVARGNAVKSLYTEAAMYGEMGQFGRAIDTLKEARRALASDPHAPSRWGVELDVLEGEMEEKQGRYGRAEGFFNSAIRREESLLGESRVGGLAYVALGRVHAAQNHRDRSLSAYRRGFEILGQQGGSLKSDDVLPYLRMGLAEAEASPGRRQELFDEMFTVSQLVSGPIVNQTIAQLTARLESSDAKVGSVIRELQDAERERERLGKRIDVLHADAQMFKAQEAQLSAEWKRINQEIDDLQLQVQVASPRYQQLLLAEPIPAKKVRQMLKGNEALSQIVLGTGGGFGFLVESNGVVGYRIDLTEPEALRYVKELRAPVEDRLDVPPYPVQRAHELYSKLYGPVNGRMADIAQITVVPSGPLLSLPFAMLVVDAPPRVEGLDYSRVPWMVEKHALTLAPSVQSWANLRGDAAPSTASSPFFGFGDALSSGSAVGVMRALRMPQSCEQEARLIANAPRLPDTAFELREIAKTLGASEANLALGPAFTKANVRSKNLASYRVISFATHGLLPSKLQCLPEPALLVTATNGADPSGDALLKSSEVVDLKMDADVVVLSACDTGGGEGKSTGGEALSGLARAFFFAGARNLLVSHWEVPSAATTELLVRTFEGKSRSGRSLAEALRSSQLGIIATRDYSHPKAWAGFTVVGQGI